MLRSTNVWSVEWPGADGVLGVTEPTRSQIVKAGKRLASYYNDPHNRDMLGHEEDSSTGDVLTHYEALWDEGGRPVLLFVDRRLVGDADLRRIEGKTAEFAILLGDRSLQGKGLGTRFGVMVHALAFGGLGLERVYASVVPENLASQRSLSKLGYEVDKSAAARRYSDEPGDVILSLGRYRFDELHGASVNQMDIHRGRLR